MAAVWSMSRSSIVIVAPPTSSTVCSTSFIRSIINQVNEKQRCNSTFASCNEAAACLRRAASASDGPAGSSHHVSYEWATGGRLMDEMMIRSYLSFATHHSTAVTYRMFGWPNKPEKNKRPPAYPAAHDWRICMYCTPFSICCYCVCALLAVASTALPAMAQSSSIVEVYAGAGAGLVGTIIVCISHSSWFTMTNCNYNRDIR